LSTVLVPSASWNDRLRVENAGINRKSNNRTIAGPTKIHGCMASRIFASRPVDPRDEYLASP